MLYLVVLGISDMFKTPSKEGRRRSEHRRGSSAKTPLVANEPAVVDPSVLNTPEEPGKASHLNEKLYSAQNAGGKIMNLTHLQVKWPCLRSLSPPR